MDPETEANAAGPVPVHRELLEGEGDARAAFPVAASPPALVTDPSIWRRVLVLAWPVLVQQFLILAVGLSDRFLAGYFQPMPAAEQAEALGHQLTAIGLIAGGGSAPGMGGAIAAEGPWELGRRIKARHIAYQSAQTNANYLAWF